MNFRDNDIDLLDLTDSFWVSRPTSMKNDLYTTTIPEFIQENKEQWFVRVEDVDTKRIVFGEKKWWSYCDLKSRNDLFISEYCSCAGDQEEYITFNNVNNIIYRRIRFIFMKKENKIEKPIEKQLNLEQNPLFIKELKEKLQEKKEKKMGKESDMEKGKLTLNLSGGLNINRELVPRIELGNSLVVYNDKVVFLDNFKDEIKKCVEEFGFIKKPEINGNLTVDGNLTINGNLTSTTSFSDMVVIPSALKVAIKECVEEFGFIKMVYDDTDANTDKMTLSPLMKDAIKECVEEMKIGHDTKDDLNSLKNDMTVFLKMFTELSKEVVELKKEKENKKLEGEFVTKEKFDFVLTEINDKNDFQDSRMDAIVGVVNGVKKDCDEKNNEQDKKIDFNYIHNNTRMDSIMRVMDRIKIELNEKNNEQDKRMDDRDYHNITRMDAIMCVMNRNKKELDEKNNEQDKKIDEIMKYQSSVKDEFQDNLKRLSTISELFVEVDKNFIKFKEELEKNKNEIDDKIEEQYDYLQTTFDKAIYELKQKVDMIDDQKVSVVYLKEFQDKLEIQLNDVKENNKNNEWVKNVEKDYDLLKKQIEDITKLQKDMIIVEK